MGFDLYLPLMGNLLYVVISCYLRSFSEEAFSMVMLSRTLGLAMVIFAANVGICFLLKKTLPDQPFFDLIATAGYNFVYVGIIAVFRKVRILFWILVVYCMIASAFHSIQIGVQNVRISAEQNLSSSAQIQAQNVMVLIVGAIQAVTILLLAFIL